MIYQDRRDAGRQLGAALQSYSDVSPVVIGLVRGGVPVAAEVARVLQAPLDVLIVRKLGATSNPEYGVGAIAEETVGIVNTEDIKWLRISQQEMQEIIDRERQEIARRQRIMRGNYPALPVSGKTVILVDDGLATGMTARVAIKAMREREAVQVIFAVPVGAEATVRQIGDEADSVVCLQTPQDFRAVGSWYHDFRPTTDDEVLDILSRSRG